MPVHFSRTLRAISTDNSRRTAVALALVVVFLGAWTAWFLRAPVAVYAATRSARIEVARENHPIDAPIAGRVHSSHLKVGELVNAGDVLLEIDAETARLALEEVRARLAPMDNQIQALKSQIAAEERALAEEQRAAAAASAESNALAEQARASAEFAADEAKRLASLNAAGLVSELESLRARNLSKERASAASAAEFASGRTQRDFQAREQDRRGAIAGLRQDIAEINRAQEEALAATRRLSYELDQHLVRAPISGRIAEVASLRPGGMVSSGDRICTIVPEGVLRVVASFPPSVALGRVQPGQSARVRLEGFPWTQYGSAPARVATVAGEVRNDAIRVELLLEGVQPATIPFQHGLPAEVDVEIERIPPATMILRSVGRQMLVAPVSRP